VWVFCFVLFLYEFGRCVYECMCVGYPYPTHTSTHTPTQPPQTNEPQVHQSFADWASVTYRLYHDDATVRVDLAMALFHRLYDGSIGFVYMCVCVGFILSFIGTIIRVSCVCVYVYVHVYIIHLPPPPPRRHGVSAVVNRCLL
jgi:hypothetical protein